MAHIFLINNCHCLTERVTVIAKTYFFLLTRDTTRPAMAMPIKAIDPGSGILKDGAANAMPVLATKVPATAAKNLLTDFIVTPLRVDPRACSRFLR